MGPGNKKWLNLNLGAEYAREGSEHFNPEAVPTGYNDWKAFGSLYNYNRDSDGHELVQYRRGTTHWEVKHKNGYNEGGRVVNGKYSPVEMENVTSDTWGLRNDPCPNGYHVVDADVLRNAVGYSIQGTYDSPSVIKHPDYQNWTLVTAPVWDAKKVEYNIDMDGYLVTFTSVFTANGQATSAIWLQSDGRKYNPLSPTKVDSYDYATKTWSQQGLLKEHPGNPSLDRGVYVTLETKWPLGVLRNDVSVSAVRCIEN